uniref:Protein kinase domain-containing protein n=2 Tax=Caenorhabditis japonica TaxID=281687 RepID=A0A8R1HQP4_CAEJA
MTEERKTEKKEDKKETEEEDEAVEIKEGFELVTNKNTYIVGRLLGAGGFGAVFLMDTKDKNGQPVQYAMKVEKFDPKRRHSKLKMEIAILKKVQDSPHFTKMIDRGKKDECGGYFFIIMDLVGSSLDKLKRESRNGIFSFNTALGVGSQCLEAVEELHKNGYIHRDLKPPNYAIGLAPKRHLIYILDFGIARKFTNVKNELKTPREKVNFKGTIRYASLACHQSVELGPKDDCECVFYIIMEFLLIRGLPWRKTGRQTFGGKIQKRRFGRKGGQSFSRGSGEQWSWRKFSTTLYVLPTRIM